MREFLLLCNRPVRGSNADTILEHLNALKGMQGVRVRDLSMLGELPAALDLRRFDAIGIHYTLHISDPANHWLSQKAMDRIAAFRGHKSIWMHDEYRRVDDVAAKLRHMGINTIFTVIPEDIARIFYSADRVAGATVHTVLTGYVSPSLKRIKPRPFAERSIDISYRARRPPFWLGRLGQEKIEIGLRTKPLADACGLVTDIAIEEADRLYGEDWITFLQSSKAMLCVESGASVIDFSGEIEQAVDAALRKNPKLTFSQAQSLISEADGRHVINCISPRIFEMAACRTLIIAHPGAYSGIIKPWIHYVPLEKDFSNFDTVNKVLRDTKKCEYIITRAYDEIIASGKYDYKYFSEYCARRLKINNKKAMRLYSDTGYFIACHSSFSYLWHNYSVKIFQKIFLCNRMRKILIQIWLSLPIYVQDTIRPMMKVLGR